MWNVNVEYIKVELIRNNKKEIDERRIYASIIRKLEAK